MIWELSDRSCVEQSKTNLRRIQNIRSVCALQTHSSQRDCVVLDCELQRCRCWQVTGNYKLLCQGHILLAKRACDYPEGRQCRTQLATFKDTTVLVCGMYCYPLELHSSKCTNGKTSNPVKILPNNTTQPLWYRTGSIGTICIDWLAMED